MPRMRFLVAVLAVACVPALCGAGDRIIFSRVGPTRAGVYISNADGSGEHPLGASGSLDYDPAWSPKGDWIAFTSERAGSPDIYRVHPDGTGLERLTDDPAYDDQAAFSPDEKQIVFVSTRAAGTANLWILDVATRKAHSLTSGRGGDFRPSWSPDGAWIAFSSDRESNLPPAKNRWERLHLVDIYIIHPDGSGLKRISEHGNFCGSPKWARDSKSVIAYCMLAEETFTYRVADAEGETSLVQINIANGETTQVKAGPGVKEFPSLLPSGEVAYVRRQGPVQGVFYGNGSRPGPAGSDLYTPSWSPDGAQVAYSRRVENRTAEPAKLWSRNANFELYRTAFLPSYDPSGEHLAVTMMNPDQTSSLLIVDEGKPARAILERKELILGTQWSHDGRRIIFAIGFFSSFLDFAVGNKKPIDRVNGGAQVGVINPDGSDFHLITSGPNNNAFPSFSPDGKQIVYRTAGPDGEGLRIMNLQDHSAKVLTKLYDNFPAWSPGGDTIAFVRKTNGNFEIFTIRPDGTDLRQLTNTPGNEAHVAWSPDGKRMVFASTRMGFKDEAPLSRGPQPYGEIFVMNSDGTHLEQLTDNQWEDGGPSWAPEKSSAQAAALKAK
jgi:Tol biopolymer transport system component